MSDTRFEGRVALVTGGASGIGEACVLTKTAALEYAAKGLRINAVGPAFIDTPLLAGSLDDAARENLGRLGTSQQVANLVAFLASDAASFLTGAPCLADGGYTAR